MEVANDILDLLEQPRFDNSIESYQYVTYEPASQNNLNNRGAAIAIEIQAADKYLHPSRSYLYIKGQLVRADNQEPYAADAEIALVNNAMMFLFSNIMYVVGAKEMESINCPGQATSLLGYLTYPDDFNSGEGLMSCWSKDTSVHASSVKYVPLGEGANRRPAENPQFNQGYTTRKNFLMDSNPRGSFSFMIPFSHMFGFADYSKVLYNIKQTLKLTRYSDDHLAIHRAAGVVNGSINLTEISWRMPELEIEPKALSELTRHIVDKKSFPIHYSGRYCESLEIPVGARQHSWAVCVANGLEKPRWIFIAFQTDKNETQEQNTAVFNNLNLEKCNVVLDTKPYPMHEVNVDFQVNDYSKIYEMMSSFKREHYGFNNLIGGTQINVQDFKKLFPIFGLDVRNQKDKLTTGVMSIQMKFRFREPVPANTTAYAVILSDRLFKLQSDGGNLKVINY
jgi:hypothetical protein